MNKRKKYIDIQDSHISNFIKGKANWYLPKSGLWGKRYMEEKADVLTSQRTAFELDIIKRYAHDKKNILDIPCGYGRIANSLAADGFDVTGVDINEYFLDIARRQAKNRSVETKYIKEDMIKFRSKKKFDVVLNIFTSIGYYDSEYKNQKAIDNLCRLVKPDGTLVIETINPYKLLKEYRKKRIKITAGGTKVIFENFFDYKTSTNVTRIVERDKNGKINKASHCIRIYFPHELINICLRNGLNLKEILNERGKTKNILDSIRLWLIFRKSK